MRISRISEAEGVDALNAIRSGSSASQPLKPGAQAQEASGETTFLDVVQNVVQSANADQSTADAAMKDLMSGNVDNIHNVVLSVAKADLSFRFLMEVRNKVTEAYQEISRMQL